MKRREAAVWMGLGAVAALGLAATWNSGFEGAPANTESVGLAASRIRDLKVEIRNREETEHDFGALGNVTTDTGRHLPGSARAFFQSSAPTVDGTTTPSCLAEADANGNRHCDGGRLWFNTSTNRLSVTADGDADGDADSWQLLKIDGADVTSGTVPTARLDATATPTAGKIPIADGSGKLAAGWLPTATSVPTKICDSNSTSGTVECTTLNGALYRSYTIRFNSLVGAASMAGSTPACLQVGRSGSYDTSGNYAWTRSTTFSSSTIVPNSAILDNCIPIFTTPASGSTMFFGTIDMPDNQSPMVWNAGYISASGGSMNSATGAGFYNASGALTRVRITGLGTGLTLMSVYGNP